MSYYGKEVHQTNEAIQHDVDLQDNIETLEKVEARGHIEVDENIVIHDETEALGDKTEVEIVNSDTEAEIAASDHTAAENASGNDAEDEPSASEESEEEIVNGDGAETEAEIAASDTGEGNIDAPDETGMLAATEVWTIRVARR